MFPKEPSRILTFLLVLLLLLPYIPFTFSSLLPTIAISHFSNQTLICALFPTHGNRPYQLNCTALPSRTRHSYPSGPTLYSAVAAGNGFLCAVGSSNATTTMRWWDFTDTSTANSKRVYRGPAPLAALSASDSHVCGLLGKTLRCWRWPRLSLPVGINYTGVAVGGDFVCGLLQDSMGIRCYGTGGGGAGVVGHEPPGSFTVVAAGVSHACGISVDGRPICWGPGAPVIDEIPPRIGSVALGNNRSCAMDDITGKLRCWGNRETSFSLPADLMGEQFMAVQGKGNYFCGVLMVNFSLVCWGGDQFSPRRNSVVVFERVLPSSCATSCPCGVMPDSGTLCTANSSICMPCNLQFEVIPPSSSPTATGNDIDPSSGHSRSSNKKTVIFVTLGCAGVAAALAAISFLLFSWYSAKSVRVHDSGRLVAVAPSPGLMYRPPHIPGEGGEPGLEHDLRAFGIQGPSPTVKEFPLTVLLEATANFSDSHKIGSGSFGAVYSAIVNGRRVAIKRAEPFVSSSHRAEEDRRQDRERAFVSELALLSRVNHKNLVRLLGFCDDGSERVLVYEFMPNGTLHDHLHKLTSSSPPLSSWAARMRVALDAARGLEYLHVYAVPPIIHRDVKSSNILLDDDWSAKVSDFGLSLLSPTDVDDERHATLRAAGTVGYMDPEYYRLRHLTAKSDVYSFGVVLLELLSGCRAVHRHEDSGTPRNVVEFAVPQIEADNVDRILDSRLPPPAPSEIEAVRYVGYLAADCVSPEGRRRPSMTEIVGGLDRALAACVAPTEALTRSTTTRSV